MRRVYKRKDVLSSANDRIDFIFKNFRRRYLSFSGGKDSGVMLNLCIEYMRRIRDAVKDGVSQRALAVRFGVGINIIMRVIRGEYKGRAA